jgi:hypothetical protein
MRHPYNVPGVLPKSPDCTMVADYIALRRMLQERGKQGA